MIGGGLERGEMGRWVRAGGAAQLAGGSKLSEGWRNRRAKLGLQFGERSGAQRGCAGEVAGKPGPATETSSVPGVRADGHRAERGTAKLIQSSVLAGKAKYVGKARPARKQCL